MHYRILFDCRYHKTDSRLDIVVGWVDGFWEPTNGMIQGAGLQAQWRLWLAERGGCGIESLVECNTLYVEDVPVVFSRYCIIIYWVFKVTVFVLDRLQY